jgi:citrate lyase gamma subunit
MLYDLIAPLEEQDNTLIISAAVEQQITAHIRTFNGKFQGGKK